MTSLLFYPVVSQVSQLTFTLVMSLVSLSGVLSLVADVAPLSSPLSVVVRVTDGGGREGDQTARVEVRVAGAVTFPRGGVFRFTVSEVAEVRALVGEVITDSLSGKYSSYPHPCHSTSLLVASECCTILFLISAVRYTFVSPSSPPYFSLDGATGKVRLQRLLGQGSARRFLLAVKVELVTDSGATSGSWAQVTKDCLPVVIQAINESVIGAGNKFCK